MEIKFQGALYGARIDREGQWKVTFEVPASESVEIAKLSALTESVLDITVNTQE